MRFTSIRFKTNILYTLILGIILILYSAALYYSVSRILFKDVDDKLRIKANEIAQIIYAYESLETTAAGPFDIIAMLKGESFRQERMIIDDLWRSDVETLNLKQDFIHILIGNGERQLYSGNLTPEIVAKFQKIFSAGTTEKYATFTGLFPSKSRVEASIRPFFSSGKGSIDFHSNAFNGRKVNKSDSLHLRAIRSSVRFRQTVPITIQIATSLESVEHILNKLLLFMSLSILTVLSITSFMGGFFVQRILQPVLSVIRAADQLSHRDLRVRIKQTEKDVEMILLIDSFNRMIERLEKSFSHISEFSSHVAHELKTPLAIVRGELELALEKKRAPEEYQRTIENCLEEVGRMTKIIRDLLLLAKLDYQPGIFKFEEMDLRIFLEDIDQQSRILAADKEIALSFENETSKPICIRADPVHLRRLFLNLINNAIKFTPANGRITIRINPDREKVRVAISDTGIGISAEHQAKIFEKFYKVQEEDRGPDTGSGLGLSIALSIAKAHGGDIQVQSHPQAGSTFSVILPVVYSPSQKK